MWCGPDAFGPTLLLGPLARVSLEPPSKAVMGPESTDTGGRSSGEGPNTEGAATQHEDSAAAVRRSRGKRSGKQTRLTGDQRATAKRLGDD